MSNNSSLMVVNTTNTTINSLSFIDRNTFKLAYYAFNHKYGSVVSNLTLVVIALSIIYVGSSASLSRPKSAPKLHKSHPEYSKLSNGQNSQDLDQFINEHIAILVPVFCTAGLLSIHYATKVVDSAKVSWVFNNYTLFFSLFAFAQFFQFLIKVMVMKIHKKGWDITNQIPRFRFSLTQDNEIFGGSDLVINDLYEDDEGKTPFIDNIEEDFEPPSTIESKSQILNVYISSIDIVSIIISGLFSYAHYVTQESPNWIFSNFVACCFAFEGIAKFHLSSFKTGAIVLIGLFFYDIYFVFKSDIMVSVASSIDIPIMMRLPSGQNYENISIQPSQDYIVPKLPFSMLGLGDIVIPGAFIAMCYRYDLYKHHVQHKDIQYEFLNHFKAEYFKVGIFSYVLGLGLTFLGLHYSQHPQPALLYLSPSLIFGVLIKSLLNGELKELYKYSEIDEEEQKRKKEFEKKKEEEKKKREEAQKNREKNKEDGSNENHTGESVVNENQIIKENYEDDDCEEDNESINNENKAQDDQDSTTEDSTDENPGVVIVDNDNLSMLADD